MPLRAVLFDFDGTLTRPGAIDFCALRRQVGCPPGTPVLEYIARLPDARLRRDACERLERFERLAADLSVPNQGAEAVVGWLRSRGLRLGIISRNSRRAIDCALNNFPALAHSHFDIIVTRDDPVPPKPAGDGIRLAARCLGIRPAEMAIVGDYVFDIEAGQAAGTLTVFLQNTPDREAGCSGADYTIKTLEDLSVVIEGCTAGQAG
jgi:hydrogenase expression/formation protein HypE